MIVSIFNSLIRRIRSVGKTKNIRLNADNTARLMMSKGKVIFKIINNK